MNNTEQVCLLDKKAFMCLNLGYKNNSKIRIDENDIMLFRECMSDNKILNQCYELGSELDNLHKYKKS